jgi:hypothetical protein
MGPSFWSYSYSLSLANESFNEWINALGVGLDRPMHRNITTLSHKKISKKQVGFAICRLPHSNKEHMM